MRRLLTLALLAVTACTPAQRAAWLVWHAEDPTAAVAFLETYEEPSSGVPGDCASYRPLLAAHGLPVDTFARIAWRESGCNHRSFVIDADDAGGGLLGINLKGRLAATWREWCGVTLSTVTDAETNVRCAAEAYRRLGLRPWS